ncbi:hypothetical protein DL98DRAFT_568795 [Cadophora sp. DSE1049]|nr:hypothetical protein DL98DRAFT_568795 [Cadophora sp. DSE1049]
MRKRIDKHDTKRHNEYNFKHISYLSHITEQSCLCPFSTLTSHDFAVLLHTQSLQENIEMASVSSSAISVAGLTPPDTPPALTMTAKKQIPVTPTSIRRSARGVKPTEKGAQFTTPKKVQKALVTPSPSPPQVVKKLSATKNGAKSVEDGKSDQAEKAASSPPKLMLRFAPEIVLKSFRGDSTVSPSPPSSAEGATVISAPALKKGGKAKSTIELNITKGASKPVAATASMSASDSDSTAVSDNILPSIEDVPENEVEELEVPVAANKKTPPKPARNPATKPASKKKAPKNVVKQPEPKTDTLFQESSLSSQTPPNNETAKDVSKPAPASKKRGYGSSESASDKDTANGRPSKFQKVSPLGRKQNVVAPEPIVDAAPPGPDETELTAWLFACGKEGSEKYLRKKFPRCKIEAYGYGTLDNYKFILHSDGYAKAIEQDGSELYGAIWKIPEKIRATLEKKAGKHGMKYVHVPDVQPMRRHPDYEPNCWSAPWVSHAEPLKCWMGVCENLDGKEEKGKAIVEDDFFKRRGLSRVIMEMEMAGVPGEYVQKCIRSWVPPPRNAFDTGYFIDHKRVKPSKKK